MVCPFKPNKKYIYDKNGKVKEVRVRFGECEKYNCPRYGSACQIATDVN
jgi:hypothetical protein